MSDFISLAIQKTREVIPANRVGEPCCLSVALKYFLIARFEAEFGSRAESIRGESHRLHDEHVRRIGEMAFSLGQSEIEEAQRGLEIRDFVNFKSDNSENVIYVGIGLGYRFNLSARKTEKDKTVEKLENYLRK